MTNSRQLAFIDPIMEKFGDYGLPDYMWEGMSIYLLYGILPGHFLTALLSDDLRKAVFQYSDANNMNVISDWVSFIHNEIPSVSWGSDEKVKQWSYHGGWIGLYGNQSE